MYRNGFIILKEVHLSITILWMFSNPYSGYNKTFHKNMLTSLNQEERNDDAFSLQNVLTTNVKNKSLLICKYRFVSNNNLIKLIPFVFLRKISDAIVFLISERYIME